MDDISLQAYPKPPDLAPPAMVSSLDARGWLVRCFDEVLEETRVDHLEAIGAIEESLLAAGVLVPFASIAERPPPADPQAARAPIPAPAVRVESPAPLPPPVRTPTPFPAHALPTSAKQPARVLEPVLSLGETVKQDARPAKKAPTMPFAAAPPGRPAPPPGPRAPLEPNLEMGAMAPLDKAKPAGPALPFPSIPVERYAVLCVELSDSSEPKAHVLARHGVGEDELTRLHADYRMRFAKDPALYGQWAGLMTRYREVKSRR